MPHWSVWAIVFLAFQVICFDLRPGPANIEDAKTIKSQEEEPCVCYITTKISVSVSVTISVTIIFYLSLRWTCLYLAPYVEFCVTGTRLRISFHYDQGM